MKKYPALHDALFKKFLGDINIARDFLDIHLPASLRERCDFSTLAIEYASFIEHDLRCLYSDMLYSLKTTTGPGLIYCLIEHQSRPEKMMALRMHRYSLAALQQHMDQNKGPLPLVIPILFYHGRTSPYPHSTCWFDCFTDPALAKAVFTRPFPLVDITAMPDDEILNHRRVALLELVQKHIRTRDMLELAGKIKQLLNQWALPSEQFRCLMYYIAECGNTSDTERLMQDLAGETIDYQEEFMTIAEYLRAKGLQEGRQEGNQGKGVEIACRLIADGIARTMVKHYTGLTD